MIYQAARARLGESRFHLGHRLGAFTQDDGGVTAYFFDRNGSHRATARGDVLIGADGIHSFVRETLFPNEGPARWNGTDAVARRGRLAAVPHRPLDGDRGRAWRRSSCSIRSRAGTAPDRRLTNWAVMAKVSDGRRRRPPRRTGRGPAAGRISARI